MQKNIVPTVSKLLLEDCKLIANQIIDDELAVMGAPEPFFDDCFRIWLLLTFYYAFKCNIRLCDINKVNWNNYYKEIMKYESAEVITEQYIILKEAVNNKIENNLWRRASLLIHVNPQLVLHSISKVRYKLSTPINVYDYF